MSSKLKIAVIAGTSEATELINLISDRFDITAFTATSYGSSILVNSNCRIIQGRLDETGFAEVLPEFDAIADMSHPFAEIVSDTVKKVCRENNLPYFRGGRETVFYDYDRILYVNSKEEAAELLKSSEGNIFLTTGVKTLKFYETELYPDVSRIWARVLDSEESRRMCADSAVNIIYSKLPVPEEETDRIMRENNIRILVTKDSGVRGGLPEKIETARKYNAEVIIIKSPENGISNTPEKILEQLLKL